ncbi:restriction endonuclease subunit S [Methanosarcina mazei]|uniref:Type I restriction-modification system, specificity subunit S n=2 Tax=Methanosarcina mazei TaxID=2209 RepID=A0A0E3PWJ6_METMZ|nr:restriction endonuclease subunit S [Methanosarcina mazei]AAM32399.1 type I restriction-modification system specificity subunit [Methanosarcina mazei Go1]AKB40920.1 Type I restriction-modification system, specificity subunit S [Methanosarcina mazei WWM610]WIM42633.1 restriction endonuclease subunit S [Methanosarcina mazei]WIM46096.1 restriction endonuclease subunit S [Methanosarcina mazei]
MQQKSELPEGWAECQIKDIVVINYGKGLKKSDRVEGQFDVFGSNGIVGKHNQSLTNGPTVIIGRKGSVGEINLSSEPCWPIDTTYYIDNFYGINRIFLYYLLKTLNLANYDTSTAIPGINRNDIYSQLVPLPPLSEQHRIVSAIEALFARLDATNEKLDRVQEILKKFRESVLAAACDGRLTEEWRKENLHCNEYFAIDEDQFNLVKQWRIPTVWSWSTLEDSCSHVVDCPHSTPKWTDIGVYCVRTSELKCGHIDFSNAKYVSEATYLERIKRLKPQEGDILYSREGTVGIASLVPSNVKICLGQRLMLFRTKNNLIPSFFVKVLNSPYIYDSVKKSTMGSTAPRFNVADIKKFPTPLPPLPEQQEIVRRVDALFAFADSIETKVAAAREKTEKLRQSILAKAFSGQLVETQAEIVRREGRDYETAEVLIERIKEERKQ